MWALIPVSSAENENWERLILAIILDKQQPDDIPKYFSFYTSVDHKIINEFIEYELT